MNFNYPYGATPLDPNEIEGLIPSLITQGELNEWEAANINNGLDWAKRSRWLKRHLVSPSGLFRLHERMFNEVWEWAGKPRKSLKNIGSEPPFISMKLSEICENVNHWIENNTFNWPEIAVRFHHRIVSVHPFPNGNGRHARMAADLLLYFYGKPMLTWGKAFDSDSDRRLEYIEALREADAGHLQRLIEFSCK